jgi:hypothetical protein
VSVITLSESFSLSPFIKMEEELTNEAVFSKELAG